MENIRQTKKIGLNTLISWGASIVIIGLTFKLLHWEGGEWMIAIGLLTESCLFFLLGYASLNDQNGQKNVQISETRPVSRDINELLETTVDKKAIERLKESFEHFNKTVESVNSITDSAKTTQDMMREMESATQEVQRLRKNLEELNTVYKAQLEAFRKS